MIRVSKSRRKRKAGSPTKKPSLNPIDAQGFDAQGFDLARLRELYYWSCEPGFLEVVRTLAAMPENARAGLEAFVSMAHDPSTITATLDPAGRLTLASPQVAETIAIAQHCTEFDDNGPPPLLH
jgi:hypothetical protein